MKKTIDFSDFQDAFQRIRPNKFTYEGLGALFDYIQQYEKETFDYIQQYEKETFDYIQQYEKETGEELELDVISFCCEYTEYEDIEAFHADYNPDVYPDAESIENRTIFIPLESGGFIIQNF